ncbi:MAG TPA: phosphatase PAP2 family protein [Polyangiaceae bacterium]|nr:phosphatase PAP2 family protein [Polyangiaceae bacterium]
MSHRAAPCFLAALWVTVIHPASALAEQSQRGESSRVMGAPVHWDPAWPEFQTGEWIASGVGLAALLTSRVLPLPGAHWRGGIGFDEGARDALRFHTPASRRRARDGSDIGITISASWPFFDALVVAGWYRNSPQVGTQQALISAEVLAVTAGMQGLVSLFVSRERPYGRECGGELPEATRDCANRDRYFSFYSGHSANSFAAAAVNCMHHAYVPLYGGGAADSWACVGMFGVAATTALMRVATDVHYVSDVLVGASIGTTTGLLLPWALHYRHGATPTPGSLEPRLSVLPVLSPTFQGLSGVLIF